MLNAEVAVIGGKRAVAGDELASLAANGLHLISIKSSQGGNSDLEAYCVKCKSKKEMKDPTATTMKNGKPATTGTCSTCGTKMFKIGKTETA